MSGTPAQSQQDWVQRVLGVATSSAPSGAPTGSAQIGDNAGVITDGADFPKRWEAAMAAWRSGIEQVDAQIEALGKHLTASDDQRLRAISETGLNAITGNHKYAPWRP